MTSLKMNAQYSRRRLIELGACLGASALLPGAQRTSWAQTSTGRIILGFAAGGGVDATARVLSEYFSQKSGKTYITENRVGAAGRLAVDAVKSAKPDGDTLLVCPSGPLTLFPFVFKNLKYDPFKDLAPIARLTSFDTAIGVGPMSGTDTLQKFVAWAKANPNKATYGSSGAGTLLHFTGVGLAQKTGVPMAHVGYRGAAPAVLDLIAGQVPMVVAPLSDMLEQHKAGRLKVLAVTSPQRSVLAPDVPTAKEAGVDIEVPGWYALYGPAGMPRETVLRLTQLASEAVNQPNVKERFLKMGMMSAHLGPEETLAIQKREHIWWEAAVKASGFTPED